ncbi:uncharacterized protein LOC128955603 [Oppia nitens]|uniref:uncharacterized protein LOC128955603 n=1 Tax=Oppia nitens TaxID=1686743 RepID=UPI0023DA23E4|nr:uncharacterized protein LOC128955603 [Oppia nitens]
MFKIFLLILVLSYICTDYVRCLPSRNGRQIEVESGSQLDIPNDNEIPGNLDPNRPFVPRRGSGSSDGLLNTIMSFFRNLLGGGGSGGGGGLFGNRGGSDGDSGILGFIRRAFGGLIDRVLGIFGQRGGSGGSGVFGNPSSAEFPYTRGTQRFQPLRAN